MKKFQSLGRSLSKNEMTKILGGDDGTIGEIDGTVYGWCTAIKGCWSTTSSLETCRANITSNCGNGGGECDTTNRCPWP